MPRGKQNDTTTMSKKWRFKGFINYEFNPEQIVDALSWFEGRTIIISDVLMDWVDQGWKASVSFDDYKSAYVFSATAKKTGSDLDGWVLQFYHVELDRLLSISSYVLSELLENDAIKPGEQGKDAITW